MDSIKLWSVTFPNPTNVMSKTVKTLRANSQDKPYVQELVWLVDKRVIKVVLEAHAEMPNVAMIPQESLSVIVPMPKEATKAKLPDETVSSSKLREQALEDLKAQGGKPPQGRTQEASFKVEGRGILEAADNITHKYDKKPKPKKRGRPKKKKD